MNLSRPVPVGVKVGPEGILVDADAAATIQRFHPGGENTLFARVPSSGLTIAYESFGSPQDPAVILLHGLGADMTTWPHDEFVAPLVAMGFFVIRIDHRDNGQSEFLSHKPVSLSKIAALGAVKNMPTAIQGWMPQSILKVPFTLDDLAIDAIELVDLLALRTFHLIGHSMGGMVAQILAIKAPSRILSVTVVNSCLGPGPGPYIGSFLNMMRINRKEDPIGGPDFLGKDAFEDVVRAKCNYYRAASGHYFDPEWNQKKTREMIRRMTRGYAEQGRGCNRCVAAVLSAPSRLEQLSKLREKKELREPILVLHGELDPIIPVANAQHFASNVADVKLEVVPGMGHIIQKETCSLLLDAWKAHCRNHTTDMMIKEVADLQHIYAFGFKFWCKACLGILCFALWCFILFEILIGDGRAADATGNDVHTHMQTWFQVMPTMRFIVGAGCSIYPLGYISGYNGYLMHNIHDSNLDLVYNFADFLNKIAFCLSIWSSVKMSTMQVWEDTILLSVAFLAH